MPRSCTVVASRCLQSRFTFHVSRFIPRMRKPSVLVIFLTVFMDLIGFGIVLALLPLYSRNLGAGAWLIGAIQASFSAMQFLFAPAWGRLSDRIGRRPVLLVSTAGSAVSYVILAIGCGLNGSLALWVVLASRLVAGICAANITVAQAYIADITPPAERSKRMGLIGMAFGLGFVFGPPLGSLGIQLIGVSGPGVLAAGFCTLNFFLALAILPESWTPSSEHVAQRPRWTQWTHTLAHPKIGLLILVFFLATFCFASFETTLGLLISDNFHLNRATQQDMKLSGYLIAYCGIVGALVQGGLVGRLVKRNGEARVIANSLFLLAAALAPLPFIRGSGAGAWLLLLFFLTILAIGSQLTRPPLFGLISILTPAHEQGATIGVAQSAGSLARIVGPVFGSTLLAYHPRGMPWARGALPYLICAAVSLCTGFLVVRRLCADPAPAERNPFSETPNSKLQTP
ncbi:MAG: MFS transporter [Verrucomicrobia bacterium]|nr:MAG: MFS transporter [Verrucomicrobiota bacterium]